MKRVSGHLALPLAAALALGCKESPEGFVPLETGRKTVYDVEYADLLGETQRAEAIQRIEERTTIGGREYFRIVEVITGVPGHEPDIYYQRLAADGLYELRYVDDRPMEYLAIPWPLKVGKAWLVDTGFIETTCRAEARAPAILPEKTYQDAWKLSCYGTQTGSRFKSQTYLVEGVGPVRVVQETGTLKMEMRLREAD